MVYVPKKDYESNRLESGFLQLSPHTNLILDETVMENGQLDAEGVRNLTALGNVISWQKLGYNFSFHNIDFLTDVPCLVLSEGRSILPSDIQLLLKPQQSNTDEVILVLISSLEFLKPTFIFLNDNQYQVNHPL